MKLLFVADSRSPIALQWMGYFAASGHEVHLASTFPCRPALPLASLTWMPAAFSEAKAGIRQKVGEEAARSLLWGASTIGLRTSLRQWFGPLTLPGNARRLQALIARLQPDLVHALRIPYEGMLAALAMKGLAMEQPRPEGSRKGALQAEGPAGGGRLERENPSRRASRPGAPPACRPPFLISVWGNDFTLHARATPLMAYYTRLALAQADGLHADCRRDLRLARAWGFPEGRSAVVLPGNGGVQLSVFYPPREGEQRDGLTVINPRGFRAYVCSEAFFRAIPLVLSRLPEARFLCPGMAGEAGAQRWIAELGIRERVSLLPKTTPAGMAELFRRAEISISPTTHDGTPNTLLEAMACGCFPIAGDLESLREWIEPGSNGLLVDPADANALAQAILEALGDPGLRRRAAQINLRLVREQAEYGRVMEQALQWYRSLAQGAN